MLEPCEGKLSCTVLRGESGSNTADLLDSLVENKQRFISQVMTSRAVSRTCEDIDEATLSYAEIKAVATGNPLIKEKMQLENDVQRLKMLKSSYDSQRYSLRLRVLGPYLEDRGLRILLVVSQKKNEEAILLINIPECHLSK